MKNMLTGFVAMTVIALACAARCSAQDAAPSQIFGDRHCYMTSGSVPGGIDINPSSNCAAALDANMANLKKQHERLTAAFETSLNPKAADMIIEHWTTQSSWHKSPDGSWTDGQGRPTSLDQLKPEGGFTFVLEKKGVKIGYAVYTEKGKKHIHEEAKWTYEQLNPGTLKNIQDAGFQPVFPPATNDEFTDLKDLQYSEAKPAAPYYDANPYHLYSEDLSDGNYVMEALSDALQEFAAKAGAENPAVTAKFRQATLPNSVTKGVSAAEQQLP